jgi:hypothetical protein
MLLTLEAAFTAVRRFVLEKGNDRLTCGKSQQAGSPAALKKFITL